MRRPFDGAWSRALPLLVAAAMALGGCATTGAPQGRGGFDAAVTQPLRDLSVIRDVLPPTLSRAAEAPYGVGPSASCASLSAEIGALDEVLGSDVDGGPGQDPNLAENLLTGALRDLVSLPFRGVVRYASGAEKLDRLKARAILAGSVRRGFLKGYARALGCPGLAAS